MSGFLALVQKMRTPKLVRSVDLYYSERTQTLSCPFCSAEPVEIKRKTLGDPHEFMAVKEQFVEDHKDCVPSLPSIMVSPAYGRA